MIRARTLLIMVCLTACRDTPVQYVRADYEGLPVGWMQRKLTLYVGRPPPSVGIDTKTLTGAVESAARAWQAACHPFDIVVLPTQSAPRVARDSVNVVVIQDQRWCPPDARSKTDCYDPRLEALTHLYKAPALPGRNESRIEEADIQLNAVHHSLTAENLVPTMVHELGHLLGLRHACSTTAFAEAAGLTPCRADMRLAMHPDPAARRGLVQPDASELRFVCDAYGSQYRVASRVWLVGASSAIVALILLYGGARLRAARRRTRPAQ